MPRSSKDVKIMSRAVRERLEARGKPYYRQIEPGCLLGYRKGVRVGKWVAKLLLHDKTDKVETVGTADDLMAANGATVLTFAQAAERARKLHLRNHRGAAPNI
jgi:hypothetical protein